MTSQFFLIIINIYFFCTYGHVLVQRNYIKVMGENKTLAFAT